MLDVTHVLVHLIRFFSQARTKVLVGLGGVRAWQLIWRGRASPLVPHFYVYMIAVCMHTVDLQYVPMHVHALIRIASGSDTCTGYDCPLRSVMVASTFNVLSFFLFLFFFLWLLVQFFFTAPLSRESYRHFAQQYRRTQRAACFDSQNWHTRPESVM